MSKAMTVAQAIETLKTLPPDTEVRSLVVDFIKLAEKPRQPKWVTDYENSLLSDAGPGGTCQHLNKATSAVGGSPTFSWHCSDCGESGVGHFSATAQQ